MLVASMLTGCTSAPTPHSFPDFSALPAQAGLPEALVMLDGRQVKSFSQWSKERRPELKAMFEHYVYGPIPPKPAVFTATVMGEYPDFLEGMATLKLVTLETGPNRGPTIDLMLVLPNHHPGPDPVFLAMDFCGNHALTTDPRVPLAKTWMASSCAGCVNGEATQAARGTQAAQWPLAEIVRRGYALAAFYSGDVDSDRPDASTGLYAWLADGDPGKNNPTNRGTIAAWAWGFQRCVDYLVTEPRVDAHRIAAVGHSRNGKTALLAAAFDERIAMVFPHQAGCGGTAPSRGKIGESVKAINDGFPYWFNAIFKQFNGAPERLPLDQHELMALCAPRPMLISAAKEDQWSNPDGQFQMVLAANEVYALARVGGFSAASNAPPSSAPLGQIVGNRLSYYIRPGKHSMTPEDWGVFMDFADRQWKQK